VHSPQKGWVETESNWKLTDLEKAQLTPDVPSEERKRRFYWMWTVKEAYTKALGLGLGFDFSRVEFDTINRQVKIDGEIPKGWRFTMFTVPDGLDLYEGVVAEFVGGDLTEFEDLSSGAAAWLEISRATTIMRRAVEELPAV
jgi:4'-phosphopantetheinyl transferase